MFTPESARLRQFCQLGMPGGWLAAILFAELKSVIPCAAMTLLWRDSASGGTRLLHESENELDCVLVDARLLGRPVLPQPCTLLTADDPVLQRVVGCSPAARALAGHEFRTLALDFSDSEARAGVLLVHRPVAQVFSAGEKTLLQQLSPVLATALSVKADPAQLITSKNHTAIMLLDSDMAVHRACVRARKLLRLALAPPDRSRQPGTVNGLMQQLHLSLGVPGSARTASFVFRNYWGSFECFVYPFSGLEAHAEQLTAVAMHRQEPLALGVFRGCDELGLTKKQTDIALLLIEGFSNDAVAVKLRIGVTTVADHIRKIYRKVGAGNRSELVTALALGAKRSIDAWSGSYAPRRLTGHAPSALRACLRK